MNNSNMSVPECDPGPKYLLWSLRLAYSMICLLGTFGNAVVCLAILKRKRLQNSCNMFTFNLALHDLILVAVYVPTQMILMENCHHWTLGNVMCHLVYIILPFSLSVSVGTLLAITADRYRAIAFPIKAKLSRKPVFIVIGVIWMVSALTVLPLVFVISLVSPQPGVYYCVEEWPSDTILEVYWLAMFFIQYLLPLCAISVLAGKTACTLRKTSLEGKMETCTQSEMFRKTLRKRAKQTKRITKMLIALVLLYAICMLPQHVVYTFWARYGELFNKSYSGQAMIIANIFPIANSALNAIAYGTLNKEFKAVFKGLFACVCFKVNYQGELFRRNTDNSASRSDMSMMKSKRGNPLLLKGRNGTETMTSPLPNMKLQETREQEIQELSCNQGRYCRGSRRKNPDSDSDRKRLIYEVETVL